MTDDLKATYEFPDDFFKQARTISKSA